MSKQTAVQWLVDEITSLNTNFTFGEIIEQAKQMEKEQIEEAFNNSYWFIDGKEYYDKTYGKQHN